MFITLISVCSIMSANPDTVILPYGAGFVTLAQNFSFSLKLLLSLYGRFVCWGLLPTGGCPVFILKARGFKATGYYVMLNGQTIIYSRT